MRFPWWFCWQPKEPVKVHNPIWQAFRLNREALKEMTNWQKLDLALALRKELDRSLQEDEDAHYV